MGNAGQRRYQLKTGVEPASHALMPQQKTAVSMAYAIYKEYCGHVLANDLPANDAYSLAKLRIQQLAEMMNLKQLEAA